MSMKNSNDTGELPACSAVPQPPAPPCARWTGSGVEKTGRWLVGGMETLTTYRTQLSICKFGTYFCNLELQKFLIALALRQSFGNITRNVVSWPYGNYTWPTQSRLLSSSPPVTCQTTGPKPLPKRFLHIVRSRVSSFNWQHPLLSLMSSSSFLRLLPRLLVTSISPFIFP